MIWAPLSWAGQADAWYVAGVVLPPGNCPGATFRIDLPPMLHVWIVPHECGPFAPLEGVSGGQIGDGEELLCDHQHTSIA